MITLQHQSYVQDQGKAEVCRWRPTREIHKLAYQARHDLISRTRDSHQYHTLLLKAAQTPQMAYRATWTKIFQAAAPKHALGVHRQRPAMLLLNTSRRKILHMTISSCSRRSVQPLALIHCPPPHVHGTRQSHAARCCTHRAIARGGGSKIGTRS